MKAKLTPEQAETIRQARTTLRDFVYRDVRDFPTAEEVSAICDKLSAIVGERYSFRSGEVLR